MKSRRFISIGLVFIITITTSIASNFVWAGETRDLYSSKDAVLRLTSETFKPTVFHDNKNVTFLVQFYNTFCGHCQLFSPIYKELASRVRNWTSVVRVAGIDCSKHENIAVCTESKIDGYPTLYLYAPNADPNDVPLNLRSLNIEWNVDDLEETIIAYVGNLTTSHRHHPLAVEAMQPVQESDISAVNRLYPLPAEGPTQDPVNNGHKSAQDLMFIIESDQSYLGRKLILEYYQISSKLELRRILLSNKPLLKTLLTKDELQKLDNSQPLLVKLDGHDSGSRAQILVRGEAKHILPTLDDNERLDFIYNRFKSFFEQFYFEELKELGAQNHRQDDPSRRPVMDISSKRQNSKDLEIHYLVHNDPSSRGKVFAVDLLKGISYLMTHEVRIKGNLNPSEFATIRNLLTILSKYLPLDDWDPTMSKFISDMRTRLDENRATYEKNGITAQQMKDLLEFSGSEAVKSRYDREHWVSCSESDRQNKGYPCSLWLLFHSLTVGEYTKAAPVRVKPTLVLNTMRDYITKFFGCTVCSSNFQKESKNLESSLAQRNSSVLWLWKTHNHVNQRLNNERPGDHRKPLVEVLYPRHSNCPECYKTDVKLIGVDGSTLDDVEWSMKDVLDFMLRTFRANKIVSPVEMASLLASLKGKVNYDLIQSDLANELTSTDMNKSVEQWNLQSIFSASDMSICLLLYLCCIIMVLLVCNSMNFKFRRTNSKSK